jgi:hypothetical protein
MDGLQSLIVLFCQCAVAKSIYIINEACSRGKLGQEDAGINRIGAIEKDKDR